MESRHLCCLLGSVTLIFVCCVSANSSAPIAKDPVLRDTCPMIMKLGEEYSLAHIRLQDNLKFYLNPNRPRMLMKFLTDDVMYAATVDGTMVKLIRCTVHGSQCTMEEEGGTKSNNLLVVNKWNIIEVNYYNGEITVDINDKSRVMSSHSQRKATKGSVSFGGQVTFLVPKASHNYSALLQIACNDQDTKPVIQTELPPLTTTTAISTTQSIFSTAPYEGCPLYQVEVNHPSMPAFLHDNLTLAVFPTHPNLILTISDTSSQFKKYMKIHVHDFTAEIHDCVEWRGKGCNLDYRVSTVGSIIVPEKWNNVTLSVAGEKITVNINENKKLLTASIPAHYQKNSIEVVAEAPRDIYPKVGEYYVAFVNVECEVVEQKMIWPKPPNTEQPTPLTPRGPTIPTLTTGQILPTKASIIEVTTEPPTPTGISRDVAIVVGVLVGILAIIALVIIISTIKKRRSAAITERAPLQNQFQQQQE